MTQLNFINKPIFDHGALKQTSEVLRSIGIKKPLICTDKGIVEIGMLNNLRSLLSNEFTPTIFDQTPANPTEEAVNIAVQLFKTEDCDGIIGLGGGSSIDLGKAVAIMATHEGNLVDFSLNEGGMEKIQETAPLLAIPTTSGTGSEVSGGTFAPERLFGPPASLAIGLQHRFQVVHGSGLVLIEDLFDNPRNGCKR